MGWQAFVLPGVTTPLGFAAAALFWALLLLVAWVLANEGFKRKSDDGKEFHGVAVGTWALKVAMLLHHVAVAPLALLAIGCDAATRQALACFGCSEVAPLLIRDALEGPSYAAQVLAPITIGYMIADLALLRNWSLSAKGGQGENILMLVHHSFSMITWPHTIWFDFCTRYVLFLVSYELSSIFLTVNWMLSTAGRKQHPVYFASGLLFTGTFVLTRMLGAVPQLLALWHAPPWSKATEGVPAYVWMGSVTLLLPHAMNFFWGVKVVRGFASVAAGALGRRASAGKSGAVQPLVAEEEPLDPSTVE